MKSYAYVIIDTSLETDGLPRDKLYVGKSNDPFQRFEDHMRAAQSGQDTVFYRAIRAHGQQNFVLREIHECESEEAALEKEKLLIKELKTYIGLEDSRGYNSTLGGDGFDSLTSSRNMAHVWERDRFARDTANKKRWESQEEKIKQSSRMKLVFDEPDVKEARSLNMRQRWQDPAYREKMSNSHARRWRDPDFRRSVISKIKDSKNTPEEKERLARRNSEKWKSMSDEERRLTLSRMKAARQEQSLLRKSKTHQTNTTKKRMGPTSERAKESWSDPEVKARRIQAMKEAWSDPERRKNRIEALRKKSKPESSDD